MKFTLQVLAELRADLQPLLISACGFLLKSQALTKHDKDSAEKKGEPILVKHNGKYAIYGLRKKFFGGYEWGETLLEELSKKEKEKLDQLFTQFKIPHLMPKGSVDDYLLLKILSKGHIDNSIEKSDAQREKEEAEALKRMEQEQKQSEQMLEVEQKHLVPGVMMPLGQRRGSESKTESGFEIPEQEELKVQWEKKTDFERKNQEEDEENENVEFLFQEQESFRLEQKAATAKASAAAAEADVQRVSRSISWLAYRLSPILDSSVSATLVGRLYFLSEDENLFKNIDMLSIVVTSPKQKILMEIIDAFFEKIALNSDKVVSELNSFIFGFSIIQLIKMYIRLKGSRTPEGSGNKISTGDRLLKMIMTFPQLEEKGRAFTQKAKKELPPDEKLDSLSWFATYGKYYPQWLNELLTLFLQGRPSLAAVLAPLSLLIQSFTCQSDERLRIDQLPEPRFIGEAVGQYAALLTQSQQKPVRSSLESLATVLKKDPINPTAIRQAYETALSLIFPQGHKQANELIQAVMKQLMRESVNLDEILMKVIPFLLARPEYQGISDLLLLLTIQGNVGTRYIITNKNVLDRAAAAEILDADTCVRLNSILSGISPGQLREKIALRLGKMCMEDNFYYPVVKSWQALLPLLLGGGEMQVLSRCLQELLGLFLVIPLQLLAEEKVTTPSTRPPLALRGEVLLEVAASDLDQYNLSLCPPGEQWEHRAQAARDNNAPLLVKTGDNSYSIYGLKSEWEMTSLDNLSAEEVVLLKKLFRQPEYLESGIKRKDFHATLQNIVQRGHQPSKNHRFQAAVAGVGEVIGGLFLNLVEKNAGVRKVIELLAWVLKEVGMFLRAFLKKETYQYYGEWKNAELRKLSEFLEEQPPSLEWKQEQPPENNREAFFKARIEILEKEVRRLEDVGRRLLEFHKQAKEYPIDPKFETVKESLFYAQEQAIQENQSRIQDVQEFIKATKLQALRDSGSVEAAKQKKSLLTAKRIKGERVLRAVTDEYKIFLSDPLRPSEDKDEEHQCIYKYKTFTSPSDRPNSARTKEKMMALKRKAEEQARIQQMLVAEEEASIQVLLDKIRERVGCIELKHQPKSNLIEAGGIELPLPPKGEAKGKQTRIELQLTPLGKGSTKTNAGGIALQLQTLGEEIEMHTLLLRKSCTDLSTAEVKEVKEKGGQPRALLEFGKKRQEWLQMIAYHDRELEDLERTVLKYSRKGSDDLLVKLQELIATVAKYEIILSSPPSLAETKETPRRASTPQPSSLFEAKRALELKCSQQQQVRERQHRISEVEKQVERLVAVHTEAKKRQGFFSHFRRKTDDVPWLDYLKTRLLPAMTSYARTGESFNLLVTLNEALRKYTFELQGNPDSSELLKLLTTLCGELSSRTQSALTPPLEEGRRTSFSLHAVGGGRG